MSHDIPDRPWAKVGTDLFAKDGRDYLITVDYYSNFWEVDLLPSTELDDDDQQAEEPLRAL